MTDASMAAQDRGLGSGLGPTPRQRFGTDAEAAAQDKRLATGAQHGAAPEPRVSAPPHD